jgi:putative ubiquitin-RnfH superfamily antitoxin RatB of RatAB toxin-antitoxin module
MSLRVGVVVALPDRQEVVELELPSGSRVSDALAAPAAQHLLTGLDLATLDVGIWSRPCSPATPLRDGDRVEIYRPLQADPKEMRRARAGVSPSKRSRSGR